ncbi:rRNA-processing protein bfr2 [Sporothrix eucalyptigena]
MVGLKGLAAQLFAKQSLAKEFDPESEPPVDDDSDNQNGGADSDSEAELPENTQDTEHYVQVGKSKLRRNEPVALGPAYRGKRVSRKQLEEGSDDDEDEDEEEEEFVDPDTVDLAGAEEVDSDDSIDSDEAFGEDDEELIKKFTFRGSGKPKAPRGKPVSSDEEDDEDEENEEEDEDDDEEDDDEDSEGGEIEDLNSEGSDQDDEEGSDEGSDEDDEDDGNDEVDASAAKAEEETRKILAQERKQILASISQSAKADADKGFAVRQQRRTFDALLNMRIRMQKALSTANTLHTVAKEDSAATFAGDAIEEAASKTIELLNTIQGIRKSFYNTGSDSSSSKRKLAVTIDAGSSCQTIFDQMAETEEVALAKRRKVIDRWAARVQRPSASSAAAASRRFSAAAAPQALTAVLDGQLVTPDRLVRRTRMPRSCAPVQAAKKVEEDPEIYDDADFYQLLLKELVDQRTVDGTAPGSAAPTVRWAAAAAKDAKTRKLVDRKASKGRKMRYNVHAKLQNFTAPEDRRDWEPEAIDRFFSSLFGQRMALQEDDGADDDDDDDDNDDEPMGGVSLGGDEGLRLF